MLTCAVAALSLAVAVATGNVGSPDLSGGLNSPGGPDSPGGAFASPSGDGDGKVPTAWVSTRERVERQEALPCTGPKESTNFEIFSAGPSVAGVPLTDFKRRCGGTTPAEEPPANFTNYFYGHCKIEGGDTGCQPPLQIQTWPACQRSLGDYSFEGKPIPYRELPPIGDAQVVEIEFMFEPRIEVYTGSSTIVIFAENPDLANEALSQLRSREIGKPPATRAEELDGEPDENLTAPSDGAMEGELQCQY
jgi:hypothetical protein